MTKREEVLKFCRFHNIVAKGQRHNGGRLQQAFNDVTIYHKASGFSDVFENWEELHSWLLNIANSDGRFPWLAK